MKIKNCYPTMPVYRLILAWVMVSTILFFCNPYSYGSFDFYKGSSFPAMAILVVLLWAFLCTWKSEGILALLMLCFCTVYCTAAVMQTRSFYFALGCCAFLAVIVAASPLEKVKLPFSKKVSIAVMVFLMAAYTLLVGGVCCLLYLDQGTPSFDFGIFLQMFYYMKKTGLPLTTVERHTLMSHFKVHLSPVFYLLLPFYAFFPSALTLQIAQVFLVVSGLIPLALLCRQYRVGPKGQAAFFVILATYVPFLGGCLFHLHENNFLVPLVLWMFYAFERRRKPGMVLSLLLVLFVKEDAAIYAAAICLYFWLRRRKKGRFLELGLALLALLYFIAAVFFLSRYGDGAMTGRYDNLISDGSHSLLAMLKILFENPALAAEQTFTANKCHHLLLTFVPLGFLPLAALKMEDLVLLAAYVLINLLSGYDPQHMVGYQYFFGTGAILLYLSLRHYAALPNRSAARRLLTAAALASLLLTADRYGNNLTGYPKVFAKNQADRKAIQSVLDQVPDTASVLCSTFYMPSLAQRDEIYDIAYTDQDCDYVVLDLRTEDGKSRADDGNVWKKQYEADENYILLENIEGLIAVYRRK